MDDASRTDFAVNVDRERQVITIQGVPYSFALFDHMAFGPTNRLYRVVERRDDGVITIETFQSNALGLEALRKLSEAA